MTATAWSPNPATVTQANANGLLKTERKVASEGQRVFSIDSFAFAVGTGSIQVYKNGLVLSRNDDFIELNSSQVLLTDECAKGDKVLLVGFVGITGSSIVDDILRSDLLGTSGSNIIGFLQSGALSSRTVQEKLRDYKSVKDMGAKGDGVADDTQAFKDCITQGFKKIHVPAGTYRITDTLVLPIDIQFVGDGMKCTILKSEIIGASLITTASPDGSQVGAIMDMQLIGNNVVGALGNGHAINFVDPQFGAGAWTPQAMVVERVWIRQFRGFDARDHANTRISACGIICVEGLQNIFRDCLVHYCGNGIYLERTESNKLSNVTIYMCDKYGLASIDTEVTSVENCDIVGNGVSGTTDPGYPRTDLAMGNMLSCTDDKITITRNKFKNTNGTAQIYIMESNAATIHNNWIRSDGDSGRAIPVNFGIRALKSVGLSIRHNFFSHVISGTSGPTFPKMKACSLATDYVNGVFSAEIIGNTFAAQSGLQTEYCVGLEGLVGNTCIFSGMNISNNRFGTTDALASATSVDADIMIKNCVFSYSKIENNIHYAQSNVTKTKGISGENLGGETNNSIQNNMFKLDGTGAITAPYYGFLYPSRRMNSKTWDIPSLNAVGTAGSTATTTINVTNALAGEPVQVFFDKSLTGVVLNAWIAANGVVTIQAANISNAAVDPASATLGVIVSRVNSGEYFA